jgi:hypothetical protein
MARRSGHSEEELPFVALMDTMTNVVGVLIIVLVMVGIGLARSVNKVLSEIPPVTIEEYEKLKKAFDASVPKDDPKKVEDETKKLEQELKKTTETLQTLDLTKDKQNVKLVDLEDLQKQIEERKKERDETKKSVETMLAEVDKLKLRLDTTPVYTPPPATIVKLPNPRPMPENAEVRRFLVMGGKILFLNDEQFSDLLEQELKRGESTMAISKETVKGPDGKPVMVKDKSGRSSPQRKVVFDPKKLTDHLTRAHLGSREIKIEVPLSPSSPRIPMRVVPVPGAGESIEQARNLVSVFQTQLKRVKTDPKGVVWFHVFKDSIETYLAVRDIADQMGVPVGWDLTSNAYYARTMPAEYSVPFTAAAPKPGAATAVTIAPPKTTLD